MSSSVYLKCLDSGVNVFHLALGTILALRAFVWSVFQLDWSMSCFLSAAV
jgi:hypothetical protein